MEIKPMVKRADDMDAAIRANDDQGVVLTRKGKKYRVKADGTLVPLSGKQAQTAIKASRGRRKPKAASK